MLVRTQDRRPLLSVGVASIIATAGPPHLDHRGGRKSTVRWATCLSVHAKLEKVVARDDFFELRVD
ncbi:hypothetical protein CV023_00875 [Brevibacterium sp. CCUG 69071]|nr:hypothetical protein [Brevibacterium sp. CCUG 69071]